MPILSAYARHGSRVSGLLAANSLLENGRKVTDANPRQKDFLWSSGVKIVDYISTRGDKLQAALYLPANYEAGKRYPAMVEICEKESQGANNYPSRITTVSARSRISSIR